MRLPGALLCFALLLGTGSSLVRAEEVIFNRRVDALTRSEVTVTTPFDRVPQFGFLPVKVTIRNGFPQARSWEVSFTSRPQYSGSRGSRFVSSYTVSTPGGSETEHAFLVPLATKMDRFAPGELAVSVGSGRLNARGDHAGLNHQDLPSIAFSKGLNGLRNLEDLTNALGTKKSGASSGEPAASVFEPGDLPPDWRTLAGFDEVLMTEPEWDLLEPPVREMIRGWVRLGGRLHLFGNPPREPVEETIDFGEIVRWKWDGLKLPVNGVADRLSHSGVHRLDAIRNAFQSTALQTALGVKAFNPVLVFLILAAFATLVGPVNLQVLAKPGQRHRLFITTPLISLGASLLLLLIILFGDGLGGTGRRVGFVLLRSDPGERQAHLVQQQIARTGVLLGREFPLTESAWFTPVAMKRTRWTHIDNSGDFDAEFRFSGGKLGGDWFRSRSEQMHLIQAVIPTRARIEQISPGGNGQPPEWFNSLGYDLKECHIIAPDGSHWRNDGPVRNGQPVALVASTAEELIDFRGQVAAWFDDRWESRLNSLRGRPGLFLAEVEKPADQLLSTLPSLRWREDRLYLIGEVVDRSAAPEAP